MVLLGGSPVSSKTIQNIKNSIYLKGNSLIVRSFLLLLMAVWPIFASENSDHQKIKLEEARELVYEAIKAHNPRESIDVSRVDNRYDQVFYYFEATWPNPIGSPHLGNYAVNPWTGDVYNTDGCQRLTSPSLKERQETIRKQSGLNNKDYSKFRAKKPICGSD
jgi:hypothetical protein